MRTIWNGSISFGLVNIPIGLALATQRSDVAFRTLHRECGTPIKQKRWCPLHERDVEPDELVKGWEVAKGEFVIVEESDLESVALQRSQSIDILRFVKLEDVDPVVLRPHVLPRAGERRRGAPAVRAAAARDAGDGHGGGRQVRALGQGEPLPDPRAGRHARDGDALLRRRRPHEGRDRGGRRGDRGAEARAPARRAGDREPRRRVEARGLRERVPARPQGDARGEARRRGDRAAGAGRRDAGDRSDGGAAPQRRRRAGAGKGRQRTAPKKTKAATRRRQSGSRAKTRPARKSA